MDVTRSFCPVAKITQLVLFGLMTMSPILTTRNAHGQLNMEYLRQKSEEHQCEAEWWPNAQYEHKALSPKSRILVEENEVHLITRKDKCKSEFIGYIDSDFNYSPRKTTNFAIESEELIEYYKHPNKAEVKRKVYSPRQQDVQSRNRSRKDW